jgi:hypothetical protein
MGVSYAPHPFLALKPHRQLSRNGKLGVLKKPDMKKAKVRLGQATSSKTMPAPPKSGRAKKVSVLKITRPKAKLGPRGMSEIELALAKPVGISKKFCLLDVEASSHGLCNTGATMTHTACVPAFDNLDDD